MTSAQRSAVPAREQRLFARVRVLILASRFNEPITQALVRAATRVLRCHGVSSARTQLVWVPGAFELPVVAARYAKARRRPDAIIALGALIRGQTAQYDVLAHAVARGLTHVAVTSGIPVTCGVIVASTPAQARARAGLPTPRHQARQTSGSAGNRGAEATLAALEVLRLFDELK